MRVCLFSSYVARCEGSQHATREQYQCLQIAGHNINFEELNVMVRPSLAHTAHPFKKNRPAVAGLQYKPNRPV